jgi:hypothetical protein
MKAEDRKRAETVTPEELHTLVRKVAALRTVTAEGDGTVAFFLPQDLAEALKAAAEAQLRPGMFSF